jgi:HAMP domain-containing protein
MILALTVISALAGLLLLGVIAYYAWRISGHLDRIGGSPTSYLAKIRMEVRAIEQETGLIGPEVSRLNQNLRRLASDLQANREVVVRALGRRTSG